MRGTLSGKGYIKDGEGVFVTAAGDVYAYRDGGLTPSTATDDTPHLTTNAKCDILKPSTKGVITMREYLGTFELQPLFDGHRSFYGKAFVERWNTEHGTRWVLRSYGAVAATITPTRADDEAEAYDVEIGMRHLSATTLRHVKEFLAQADDVFKGVTLPWLRKAIEDGRPVDGVGSACRKAYVVREL